MNTIFFNKSGFRFEDIDDFLIVLAILLFDLLNALEVMGPVFTKKGTFRA